MATWTTNLHAEKEFWVQKARFMGQLPGYDENWNRNVKLGFMCAPPTSSEFAISRWWLKFSVEGENRSELFSFQPADKKVLIEGSQLCVKLQGKRDPKSEYRVSDLKICATTEVLQEIKDFILNQVCNDSRSRNMSSPGPVRTGVQSRVAVGGEDKENLSSGQSVASSTNNERHTTFAKQAMSGSISGDGFAPSSSGTTPAVAKPVPAGSFYGKNASHAQSSYYNSPYQFNLPQKPTNNLDALRENHTSRPSSSSSPPDPVGSQGRPIPSMSVRSDSPAASKLSQQSKPFTSFGAKLARENMGLPSSTKPTLKTYGHQANAFGIASGSYSRGSPFGKTSSSKVASSNYDQYEFRDENEENDYKDFRCPSLSPIGQASSSCNDVFNSPPTVIARTRSSSPIGLLNLGNSCYMNAVLQALFAHPSFNYDLQRINEDDFIQMSSEMLREKEIESGQSSLALSNNATQRAKNASEASLIIGILNLLRSCSAIPSETIDRQKSRLLSIKAASKKFTDSQQHDAQEFLCCVLDDLKEEHRHGFTAMKNAEGTYSSEEEINKAEDLANPVSANFDFTLRKSLSCRQCEKVASETVESFNNLSVHIPNAEASLAALQSKHEPKKASSNANVSAVDDDLPDFENVAPLDNKSGNIISQTASTSGDLVDGRGDMVVTPAELSLQDCIDHFFQKEEIQYRSEVCGHDFGGVVSYCLGSLPRVFVIHLKRFLYTVTSNVGTKCILPVTIPLVLDLSKYCAQKSVNYPKLIDSPVAPKEALKSEILSPGKISPSSTPPNPIKSRKRLWNDNETTESNSKHCENDENVPIPGAPKRSRSTTSEKVAENTNSSNIAQSSSSSTGVIPDSPHESNEGGLDDGRSQESQRYSQYRLTAIVSHTGSSSDYGHYTTDAYHSAQRKWFRFDDMTVKSISETNVLEENKWNGYIFFYTAMPLFEQVATNSSLTPAPSSNNKNC